MLSSPGDLPMQSIDLIRDNLTKSRDRVLARVEDMRERVLVRFRTDVEVAGLCDAAEEVIYRRGLAQARAGSPRTRADMERLGFFVCVDDLESELIRAAGPARVEALFDARGDLRAFRTLQKQSAWRGREVADQMHRFLASGARRKRRYARLLVEAIDLDRMPRPLDAVLSHVRAGGVA